MKGDKGGADAPRTANSAPCGPPTELSVTPLSTPTVLEQTASTGHVQIRTLTPHTSEGVASLRSLKLLDVRREKLPIKRKRKTPRPRLMCGVRRGQWCVFRNCVVSRVSMIAR